MSTHTDTSTSGAGEIAGKEFLAFTLGQEEYGIDILRVQRSGGTNRSPASPTLPTSSRAW